MVSSDTTRMLVLGVARMFEPANGYQLRRELLSWRIDEWANINPGSIYSMLSTLTKQGMLTRTDLAHREGARPVAVYTTTEEGRREIKALIGAGLVEVEPFDHTALYAALSLMVAFLSRDEVVTLLTERIRRREASSRSLATQAEALRGSKSSPPHVPPLLEFSGALAAAEREWLSGFIESIEAGEMVFFGESGMEEWQPLPNDPAWAMVREREAYLRQLGG